MPKVAKTLGPLEIKRLTTPGLHAVGEVAGLRLLVKPSGARSWVLRTMVGGRRAELGLGGFPTTTLAQARERARDALDQIRAGTDPAAERRASRQSVPWTFKRTALAYIVEHRPSWKNAKHAAQWESTLATYAYPHFGDKHVRDVDKADVLAALKPIWSTKTETATRLRNRIELVLNYATAHGYRPEGPNPAAWRGNLDAALPPPRKVTPREHFEAIPIDDVHQFVVRLRAAAGVAARALEFALLTASRTGAVRLATWDEVDAAKLIWTAPPEHMKGNRAHRVPLSRQALELLDALPRFEGTPLLFPGSKGGPLSDMALTACMRRMGLSAVPHGLRSTFRDWCAERTATPSEVAEMALAHVVGDKTEAAYLRSDLFERRRVLMQTWADFVDTAPAAGNVRPIRSAA